MSTCTVCGRTLTEADTYWHHARLGVDICDACPKTNVCGEDVTHHAMLWHVPRADSAAPDKREATPDEAHDIGYVKGHTDGYREAMAEAAAAPDERETLVERAAATLAERIDGGSWADYSEDERQDWRGHAVAALAARPAPVVNAADVEITTAAELDALPAGTIVRDRFGGYLAQGRDAMGVAWFHYPVYDHAGSSALVAGIGPVTVCFTPGLTVADEGRAEDRIEREGGGE